MEDESDVKRENGEKMGVVNEMVLNFRICDGK